MVPLCLIGPHGQVEANPPTKHLPCLEYLSGIGGWNFSNVYLSHCGMVKVFEVEDPGAPRLGLSIIHLYKPVHRKYKCVIAP
jgi:hypothetical protein